MAGTCVTGSLKGNWSLNWRCVNLLFAAVKEHNQVPCESHCSGPAGSPSRGGDVTVYVFDINKPSLPTPFVFCSCVFFCLYGPFNCISFHKFSRQLSAFSLSSSGLISALLVLSTTYLFMKVPLSPDTILCG